MKKTINIYTFIKGLYRALYSDVRRTHKQPVYRVVVPGTWLLYAMCYSRHPRRTDGAPPNLFLLTEAYRRPSTNNTSETQCRPTATSEPSVSRRWTPSGHRFPSNYSSLDVALQHVLHSWCRHEANVAERVDV